METGIWLAVGAVFLAVMGVAYALYMFVAPQRSMADRLAEYTGGPEREANTPAFGNFGRAAARLSAGDEASSVVIKRWLTQAGFRDRNALEFYGAARTVGAISFGLLAFLLTLKVALVWKALGILLGLTFGYYLPYLYIENTGTHRREDLLKSFPDALDLLVSCVEAGLGLDAAFRRVAEEIESVSPELAKELQLVNAEVNAGVPRTEALRHLDERTGLEDVGTLVNVLIQAERFGTSVARSLRVHSEHIRVRRMQRAETKAAQVSPKMTVLMILFILPTLIAILIGPAMIQVKNIVVPEYNQREEAP